MALTRREDQLIDLRLAVSAFLENAVVYQHNFETSQRNFQAMNDRFTVMITEIQDIRAHTLRQQYQGEMPED
ncbi:MAG: hypothetical protein PUP91_17215 [Rhizonema sp. PD37]|nr:hypothetical protein [Rhizonema sp. PD37]